jgi:hypothetical protein
MNIKRLALLTLALCMVAGGAAVADSRWGNYAGYSKIRVNVNGSTLNSDGVPAFMINGSTVLPLRQVAESFNAIVKWDSGNQTANIYKPNVNMFVAQEVSGKDYSTIKKPFGKVGSGSTMTFDVFVQVDNLLTDVNGFKVSILDPYGNVVDSRSESISGSPDNFWFATPFTKVKFTESGNYTVRFDFEVDGSYTTVAEKLIVSE